MKIAAALLALGVTGCVGTTSTTAYVPAMPPAAAPVSACAPAPQAAPARVIYVPAAPAPVQAAPQGCASGGCANGSCAVPGAAAAPAQAYAVTETRYSLDRQAASAATIPVDIIACGAGFIRCVYLRFLDPLLPPTPPSGSYAINGGR